MSHWKSINNEPVEEKKADGTSTNGDQGSRRQLDIESNEEVRGYPYLDDQDMLGFYPTRKEEDNWEGSHDETYHFDSANEQERWLGKVPPAPYCDAFRFQFALNGEVTSWNKTEFFAHYATLGQNNEVVTLSHGMNMAELATNSSSTPMRQNPSSTTIQVAIRMIGCGRAKVFKLTHIYWA